MKHTFYLIAIIALFTACKQNVTTEVAEEKTTIEDSATTNIQQKQITVVSTTISKKVAFDELQNILSRKKVKINKEIKCDIFLGDVNIDNFQDAIIVYHIDDPKAELEFGQSAIYETWMIALLINKNGSLTLSDDIPFTDLFESFSVQDDCEILEIKGNKLLINFLRSRGWDEDYDPQTMENFEKKLIEAPIINGKFVKPKK